MKLEGRNSLSAPVETVWEMVNDPEVLRLCIPGLKELTETGPDAYAAVLNVGIAAVKGTYRGTLSIMDKQAPTHCKIVIDGTGAPGAIRGEGIVDLEPQGEGTSVTWAGQLQVGGLVAGLGQQILGSIGQILVGQFFKSLEQHLKDRKGIA
ncbi:MAG TPA: carbon monoxide dehydrogenase subunit G [bacterium]|nr:carbon monoxide dehydrogenase subunit G [bacterium]